jgi:hypothetical protein
MPESVEVPGEIPPEGNKVIRHWKDHGIEPFHCRPGTGPTQLKHCYCEPKNCVNCSIGKRNLSKMP